MSAPLPRTADEALAAVRRADALPFPARSRFLATAARGLLAPEFDRLHALLDAGDDHDRHAGLFLAVARRDLDRVETALDDPQLRARALAAAGRLPVRDAALVRLVRTAPRDVRRDIYGVLRRSRRRRLADALLPDVVRQHGDADAAALLPACSPEVVDVWLPRVPVPPGVRRRLARTAPVAVAALLAREPVVGHVGRYRSRELVTLLARRSVPAGLLLLERSPQLMTAEAVATVLVRPRAVLELVRRHALTDLPLPARHLPRGVTAALHGCDAGELRELSAACVPEEEQQYRTTVGPDVVDPLLALLPPADRVAAVRAATTVVPRSYGRGLAAQVAALGADDRVALLTGPERERLGYEAVRLESLLPLPVAEPGLLARATAHRHRMRMSAWPALLACAQRHGDPDDHARVLGLAERAWHDRELVRTAALAEAARAPARLLASVPLAVLEAATTATLQIGDSSRRTYLALTRWLHRTVERAVVERDLARAADVALLLLAAGAGRHPVGTRPLAIDRAGAAALWERLADRVPGPVAVGRLLARHVPPGLDARLEVAWRAGDAAAARLWIADPATRDERVGTLVREAAGPVVDAALPVVAARRTDLVAVLLDRAALRRADAHDWLAAVPRGAPRRWAPAAWRRWQRLLAEVAADPDVPFAARATAASRIVEVEPLLTLARADAQPVVAAALSALAAVAPPERALAELVEAVPLAGARGRAAVAGLRRLLGRVSDARAVQLCAGVLLDDDAGVGARKAAARAVTDVPLAEVRDVLHAAWDRPDLHPDVQATVAAALLRWVHRPDTARRLAAQLAVPAVRDAVLGASDDALALVDLAAYAALVVDALSHPDPAVVAAACGACSRRPALATGGLHRITALLVDPGVAGMMWQHCHHVVRAAARTDDGAAAWRSALATRPASAAARRRLAELAERGGGLPAGHLDALTDALERAALPGAAARCARANAVAILDRGEVDIARWERAVHLARDRAGQVPTLLGHAPPESRPAGGRDASEAEVCALLRRLDGIGGTAAGLAAVTVVSRAGARARWAAPWPELIAERRASGDPDVAEAAWLVDTGS